MKTKARFYLWLIVGVLLVFTGSSWAANSTLGGIQPGIYPMLAITNHLPALYKKDKDYWNSLQKVELEIGNPRQFTGLPKLGLKNPYTGKIELGDQPQQKFGVIVDIVGEEKRLYVDTDGDGSFAGEPWVPLLNEWYGSQNYWIIAPEPITLKVGYRDQPGRSFPIEISVSGALISPGLTEKVKPFLMLEVRTWFLAKIIEDGSEKYLAVVDHNNNGCFNDPEDQLLIDYNDNTLFSLNEALVRKKGITIKSGKEDFTVDWGVYPDTLQIRRKDQ